MKKICVIIPTFKRIDDLRKCLNSLFTNSYNSFEVFVVNQDSKSNEIPFLVNEFARLRVIQASESKWWTGAVNLGVRNALQDNFDYIILLNDDNETPFDFVENLLVAAEIYKNGIIGSVVYSSLDKSLPVFSGGSFNRINGVFKEFDKKSIPKDIFETDMLGGRGVIVSTNIFEDIGLFDEKYFPHYAGDQDFWLRAKKKGYKIYINPKANVYIDENKTGVKISNVGFVKIFIFLFDKRYHANIITVTRFLFRHANKLLFPINVLFYYIYNFLGRQK